MGKAQQKSMRNSEVKAQFSNVEGLIYFDKQEEKNKKWQKSREATPLL